MEISGGEMNNRLKQKTRRKRRRSKRENGKREGWSSGELCSGESPQLSAEVHARLAGWMRGAGGDVIRRQPLRRCNWHLHVGEDGRGTSLCHVFRGNKAETEPSASWETRINSPPPSLSPSLTNACECSRINGTYYAANYGIIYSSCWSNLDVVLQLKHVPPGCWGASSFSLFYGSRMLMSSAGVCRALIHYLFIFLVSLCKNLSTAWRGQRRDGGGDQ